MTTRSLPSSPHEGDARAALTTLELAVALAHARMVNEGGGGDRHVTLADVAAARNGRLFHQGPDDHYDQISASSRACGIRRRRRPLLARPHARGGEDARFIARRLVILASEDVGMADANALVVADAAARAVEMVGLPEAALNLAQAVVYLATAPSRTGSPWPSGERARTPARG